MSERNELTPEQKAELRGLAGVMNAGWGVMVASSGMQTKADDVWRAAPAVSVPSPRSKMTTKLRNFCFAG